MQEADRNPRPPLCSAALRRSLAGLLLIATYVITGKLALMLAQPPGYASAIFPPAGIAIAATLACGTACWPAVFAGSMLLNLWSGYSQGLDATALTAALVIAAASALQAVAGGAALRRLIGFPTALDSSREVLRLGLAAPVICLISATLSVGGLFALGVFQAEQLTLSWATWWVGDTLGLLFALPLALVVLGEPRALWRGRAQSVALPMLLLFALFVGFFLKVSKWEYEENLLEYHLTSQSLAERIQARFEDQVSLLEQVGALLQSPRQVSRDDFHAFVAGSLSRFPMIRAVE